MQIVLAVLIGVSCFFYGMFRGGQDDKLSNWFFGPSAYEKQQQTLSLLSAKIDTIEKCSCGADSFVINDYEKSEGNHGK